MSFQSGLKRTEYKLANIILLDEHSEFNIQSLFNLFPSSTSVQAHSKVSPGSKTSFSSASTLASVPAASSAPTLTPVPAPAPATVNSAQTPSLTPASTAPVALTASAPAPAASSFPPSPNCRIREVHCGSQVRLVVIAIRDITKGEEITVDYSLTEWGENLVSPLNHTLNTYVSVTAP